MTLVEILITISIIGLLTVIMVPLFNLSIRHRQNSECASKMRRAIAAFELYKSERGSYPPDQSVPGDLTVPAITNYFNDLGITWWEKTTELGGRWDWDIGYHSIDASLSIWKPTASLKQMAEFDRLIDDGNLTSGKFRKVESQYHYILED